MQAAAVCTHVLHLLHEVAHSLADEPVFLEESVSAGHAKLLMILVASLHGLEHFLEGLTDAFGVSGAKSKMIILATWLSSSELSAVL